jgi:hypothetical protein
MIRAKPGLYGPWKQNRLLFVFSSLVPALLGCAPFSEVAQVPLNPDCLRDDG